MVNIRQGLTAAQVEIARKLHGKNEIERKKRKSFLMSFLASFGDPIIKILLIALGLNILVLFKNSNWFETMGIAITILIATLVSTISEHGSEAAFEKLLKEASKIKCRVRRDGKVQEIFASELVVGDIVLLAAGEKVPSDAKVISGSIEVDQSALNGETKEAKKYVCDNPGMQGFLNPAKVFSGTVVLSGECEVQVTTVGVNTFYGRLAGEVQEKSPKSPLKIKLGKLAHKIGIFGYVGAALVALAFLFHEILIENSFDSYLIMKTLSDFHIMLSLVIRAGTLAVTVIVMAVPEGLPMMITVVLSSNMKRMLKDNVLVRKMVGIETAGSMNILFSDKTGTITTGKLEVSKLVFGDGVIRDAQCTMHNALLWRMLKAGLVCNSSAVLGDTAVHGGNSTDRALFSFGQKIEGEIKDVKKIYTLPFSSENKFMATTAIVSGQTMHLVKGAPEKILRNCRKMFDFNGNLVDVRELLLQKAITEMNGKAVRVIAVAVSENRLEREADLKNLTLVALIGIRDEIRPEAVEGIKQITGAGIQTVMITGDARGTAVAIAKEIGLISSGKDLIFTSDELKNMTDDEIARKLPDIRVVARALPEDKSRLVKIAQSCGKVVGMTGDGVNDAPALKKANVGFAMGSGSEVAKEAGDIVILDDNFASIAKAVLYGRTIFNSIRKFVIFQMIVNFCAVTVSVVGPFIGVDTPITVIQMLWINLVMDTLGGLAFGGERPRKRYMKDPPKGQETPIVDRGMWIQIAYLTFFSAIIALLFLKLPIIRDIFWKHGKEYFATGFFALFMFLAIFLSLSARTGRINLFEGLRSNKQFIWLMGTVTILQVVFIYFGGAVFGTVRLHPIHLLFVVGLAFLVVPIDLCRKVFLRTKQRRQVLNKSFKHKDCRSGA